MYFEQGIQHTILIIKHLRRPGPFQTLLQLSLQWYQVIAGVSFPLFEDTHIPLPYLESAWLDSTRQFLHECSAQLIIPEIHTPQLRQENDVCIMDGFIALQLPAALPSKLNFCRLFLQVTTLSDITSLAGDSITRNAWLGLRPMPSSTDDWPVQPRRPHNKIWSSWRKAIPDSICTNTSRYVLASQTGHLTHPLGTWLHSSTIRQSPRWKALLAHSSQQLFLRSDRDTNQFKQFTTTTRLDFSLAIFNLTAPQTAIPRKDLPTDVVPAQLTTDGTYARVNRFKTPILLPDPNPPHTELVSFSDYMTTLPRWKWELLLSAFPVSDFDTLGQHLLNGDQLLLCSDGGAKSHTGSFGWVIATNKKILWECSDVATGWWANSFRSEGIGQLALVLFIEAYIDYHQLHDIQVPTFPEGTTPWIRIATDNQGLIDRIKTGLASKVTFAGAALAPEYDIVHEILIITRRIPIPLVWEHVKGHQDAKKKWYKLTWMETLNVRADYHATEGLESAGAPSHIIQTIPSSKAALRIAATDITSHYASHLRKAASRPAIIQRVAKHYP